MTTTPKPCMFDPIVARFDAEELAARRRMRPRSRELRRVQVRVYLRWLHSHAMTLDTVTEDDALEFLSGYTSNQTAHSYRSAIRALHVWHARQTGTLSPLLDLPTIRPDEALPNPIPDTVVLATMERVTPRVRDMIVLGRFAGLRASEIAAAHRMYLRGTRRRPMIRLQGKGGHWRELPAHPRVVEILVPVRAFVFPSRRRDDGGPIVGDTVSARLSADLPGEWTAHTLRHAFATEAYRRTRDLRLVQSWLGHRDPETTAGYVRVIHDHDAMNALCLDADDDDFDWTDDERWAA